MKLIVGLGNPGRIFFHTRHNIGFMVVEELAKGENIELTKKKYSSLFGEGKILKKKAVLALPLTYINQSGRAVASLLKFKKIRLEDLLVVCDDVNLEFGRIRIRPRGSAGGHKGLGSISIYLNTQDFPRLRIGIGSPRRRTLMSEYVLSNFNRKQSKLLPLTIEEAVACLKVWIAEGIIQAMNRFN